MRTAAFSMHAERVAAEKVFEPGEFPIGWFAVSHHCIPDKKERRLTTGKWFCIRSEHSKVYRVLRFFPRLAFNKTDKQGQIIMDYSGWLKLSDFPEDTELALQLSIRRAKKHEYLHCLLSHPEPSFRLAGWLAVISVGLGLIGLITGLII